jgi:hypothetical protein
LAYPGLEELTGGIRVVGGDVTTGSEYATVSWSGFK